MFLRSFSGSGIIIRIQFRLAVFIAAVDQHFLPLGKVVVEATGGTAVITPYGIRILTSKDTVIPDTGM